MWKEDHNFSDIQNMGVYKKDWKYVKREVRGESEEDGAMEAK